MIKEQKRPLSLPLCFTQLISALAYRTPMKVTELLVFQAQHGETGYYKCPRCSITLDREFMSFCDRCGQKLNWHEFDAATIIYTNP